MSKNYSFVERKIAIFFRKFPKIKSKIKLLYQYLNFFLNKKKYNAKSTFELSKVDFENMETFFGYYDKSPFNSSQDKLLFQATDYDSKKLPSPFKPIKLVLKNLLDGSILYTTEVSTYNWQQGTKLQWVDKSNFIYNTYDNDKKAFISKMVNSDSLKVKEYLYPIYDTTSNYGLTLNYSRLAKMRPDYGYQNEDKRFLNLENTNDGIFKIDFNTNEFKLIVSIDELIKLKKVNSMVDAKHKFNHIMISPDGEKFIFLHRWFKNGVKYDRLILTDKNGDNSRIIIGDNMVSHCYWLGDNKIIAFANTKAGGDAYYKIYLESDKIDKMNFDGAQSNGDGHPNIFNKKWMLFDTYPNRSRMKTLSVLNIETNEVEEVGEFFESLKFYGETRCDLHPTWSPKGDFITIDSVHENNKRNMYILTNKKIT